MRDSLPLWLRALDGLARIAERIALLASTIRGESAVAWIPPGERTNLTARLFDRARTYAPSGGLFEAGLFPWEDEMLRPPFPARGSVLVGGAGGGREAAALLRRGYSVIAFDPAVELVRAGAPAIAALGGVLRVGAYDDVVRCARGEPSPLRDVLENAVDAVLLGWGSLSLVIPDAERLALLRALRTLYPDAPVVLSFDEPSGALPGRIGTLLRRVYRALGAPGYTGERVRYAPWAGVIRESTIAEVELLAKEAGYVVAKRGSAPGRMLLMPGEGAPG